ncbi:DUF2612 domain-containing protein [Clostridium sp. BJN0013]|uniref:DUF2612 domain-containing protein n=1 Tax=Clostridium sp. BJN0013 TaxID=3236840 RepID=UPI0034C68A39
MAIDAYLNHITSQHRDKPKFIAWLTAFLNKVDDAYNCIKGFDNDFDIDYAIGNQLDILGQIIGVNRVLNFQPTEDFDPKLDDDTYRLVLKAKIGKNMWQGTLPEIYTIWSNMFPDLKLNIIDNQDMSMTAVIEGVIGQLKELLIANGYIIPKPSGVRINYVGKSAINFKTYSSMVVCGNTTTTIQMMQPKYPINFRTYQSMIVNGNVTNIIS